MALLAMLAVAVMVFAYLLVSRLHAASQFVAIDREHNAKVLNQAKQALIGYVAREAAIGDDPATTGVVEGRNPGSLPCPEAPGNFGTTNEGIAAGNCTLPAVGRLPWRTLGLEKLADAAGEPLWYVISPGWALSNSTSPPLQTLINSDSIGQLTVDSAPNNAVALIIAPGPAVVAQAGAGCAAWPQTRAPTGAPDLRNYLECGNATFPADASFVTSAAGQTFNDHVLRVTAADIVPPLEAAIAHRIEREIAPALRTVYGAASWGTSAANPLYPFAARFNLPDPGTSGYRGEDGRYQGLLPFNSSSATCGADPRCTTNFVTWNTGVGPTVTASGGVIVSSSCNFPNASTAQCSGVFAGLGTVTLTMSTRARNVAMSLRTLAPNNMTVEYGLLAYGPPGPGTSASGTFNTDGSANLMLNADVSGLGIGTNILFRLTADLGVITDHALLSPADPTTGWFVRNEWYRSTYYAAAAENTASGLPTLGCTTGTNCLRLNNPGLSQNNRAMLILAGRSINGSARPSGTLANYLEFGNNDGGTLYEQNPVSRVVNAALKAPFNDRIVVVDSN